MKKFWEIICDPFDWFIHEGVSIRWLKCMFFCDRPNRIFYGTIFSIFFLLLILTGVIICTWQTQNFFEGLIYLAILFFIIVFIILKVYPKIKKRDLTSESIKFTEKNRNNQIIGPHHGIFFLRYNDEIKQDFTVDCIKLIGEGLQQNREPFKIYECWERDDFVRHYIDPNVTHLWIIGHGRKNRISFNNHEKAFFAELPKINSKEFIAQLNCSNGEGDPLPVVNKAKSSFYSNYLRLSHQNRCYIINKMKDYCISRKW